MKVKILKPVQTKDIQYFGINSLHKCIGKVYYVADKVHDWTVVHLDGYFVSIPNTCCQKIKPIINKLK